MRISKTHLIAGILTLGIIVLMVPIEKTVSPEAHIQVFGETGLPAAGVRVEQEWADYSISNQMHFASVKTDGEGFVRFPRRTSRAPLLWRVLSLLFRPLMAAFHLSYGVDSTIFAYDSDDPHVWTFKQNTGTEPWPASMQLSRKLSAIQPRAK